MTSKTSALGDKNNESFEQKIKSLKMHYLNKTHVEIKQLQKQIKETRLTLCVGAGVTATLIGTWNKLLNEIASNIFAGRMMSKVSTNSFTPPNSMEMKTFIDKWWKGLPESTSVLEKGEYLAAQCSLLLGPQSNQSLDINSYSLYNWRELIFAQMTLDATYRLISKKIKNKDRISFEEELIDYCLKEMEKSHSELYNFDTILEILLSSPKVLQYFKGKTNGLKKKHRLMRSQLHVYNPFLYRNKPIDLFIQNDLTNPEKKRVLRIDHVHGLLDKRIQLAPIVFSETSYKNVEQSALHWSSVTIAKAVRDGVMVCVGFSGEDEDFRTTCKRLLENNEVGILNDVEKSRVYAIFNLESKIKNVLPPKDIFSTFSNKDEDCAYTIVDGYMDMLSSYYKDQYNVQLLWVENRNSIPALLNKLDCRIN